MRAHVAFCAAGDHQVGTVITGGADATTDDTRVIEKSRQDARVSVEVTKPGAAGQR